VASQFTRVADMPTRRRLRSATTDQLTLPSIRLTTAGWSKKGFSDRWR